MVSVMVDKDRKAEIISTLAKCTDFGDPEKYYNNLLKIREHTESLDNIFTLILPDYPARRRRRYYSKLIKDNFIVYPSFRRAAKSFLALYEYGSKIKLLSKKI